MPYTATNQSPKRSYLSFAGFLVLASILVWGNLCVLLSHYDILWTVNNETSASSSSSSSFPSKGVTVAFAVSVTHCAKEHQWYEHLDLIAVMTHSIHLHSIRTPSSGGRYDYQMVAFVHPDAMEHCGESLKPLGYQVLERDVPVPISEYQNDAYKRTVKEDGCCGDREFLKLYAYTLTDYPIVIHVDFDLYITKPLDPLIDAFLASGGEEDDIKPRVTAIPDAMWPEDRLWNTSERPTRGIQAMFARDWSLNEEDTPVDHVGAQGGLLIVRPNLTAFEEFKLIIRTGNYSTGWFDGDVHYPALWGGPTIQGIIPWFYGHFHRGEAIELNRCRHNHNNEWPLRKNGECRTFVDDECLDCHKTGFTDIYSVHMTICRKPILCKLYEQLLSQRQVRPRGRNLIARCLHLQSEWHRIRYDLESQWLNNTTPPVQPRQWDLNFGYPFCTMEQKYIPMKRHW